MEDIQTNSNSQCIYGSIKKMSLGQRITGVVFSPGETMNDLADKPRVLLPFIVIAFSQLVLFLSRFSLYKEYMRKSFEMISEMNKNITAEQIEQMLPLSIISGLVSTPFKEIIMWLIGTAILFGILKLFGGQGNFKHILSITGYSCIISMLYMLTVLGVSFFSGSLHMDMPLTSIANLLTTEMKGSFIYGFLKKVDLFAIWKYAVIGIGCVSVSKLSKTKVYTIISVLYTATLIYSGINEIIASKLM